MMVNVNIRIGVMSQFCIKDSVSVFLFLNICGKVVQFIFVNGGYIIRIKLIVIGILIDFIFILFNVIEVCGKNILIVIFNFIVMKIYSVRL